MNGLYAHIDGARREPLRDHLDAVASRAASYASASGLATEADEVGRWHDVGKAAQNWQSFLLGKVPRGQQVHHSSAGGLAALGAGCILRAVSIACHHTGLKDAADVQRRLKQERANPHVAEALALARGELPALSCYAYRDRLDLALALKLVHSALIDADWSVTRKWMTGCSEPRGPSLASITGTFLRAQDRLAASAVRPDGTRSMVNEQRARIRQACRKAARGPVGLYRAEVPTGGGKTRSLMEMALLHAQHHGHERVIVVVPYISIILQNAAVYRTAFGGRGVLEHHSLREMKYRERRLSQTWNAPVIVTTMVQALESLMGKHNRQLRKVHRMANSVIVLDEVQSIPTHLLDATIDTFRRLSDMTGSTVILSSATQLPIDSARPVIDDPKSLFRALARTTYTFDPTPHAPADVWTRLGEQALVICNTVRDAARVAEAGGAHFLASSMTPSHQQRVLDKVKALLARDEAVRLASTQVVEAGVELDFRMMARITAPLWSIIQAAGRCNRHGNHPTGYVHVVDLEGGRYPSKLYEAGAELVRQGTWDPNDPDDIDRYFRRYHKTIARTSSGILRHLRKGQYEQAADAYRIIDDDTVTCIVEAELPPPMRGADPCRSLIESQGPTALRRLRPFCVQLYEKPLKEALARGDVRTLGEDLYYWDGPYSPTYGVANPHQG